MCGCLYQGCSCAHTLNLAAFTKHTHSAADFGGTCTMKNTSGPRVGAVTPQLDSNIFKPYPQQHSSGTHGARSQGKTRNSPTALAGKGWCPRQCWRAYLLQSASGEIANKKSSEKTKNVPNQTKLSRTCWTCHLEGWGNWGLRIFHISKSYA